MKILVEVSDDIKEIEVRCFQDNPNSCFYHETLDTYKGETFQSMIVPEPIPTITPDRAKDGTVVLKREDGWPEDTVLDCGIVQAGHSPFEE